MKKVLSIGMKLSIILCCHSYFLSGSNKPEVLALPKNTAVEVKLAIEFPLMNADLRKKIAAMIENESQQGIEQQTQFGDGNNSESKPSTLLTTDEKITLRTEIIKTRAGVGKHTLPEVAEIPPAVFSPQILPCLLRLIRSEQKRIRCTCFRLDDHVFATELATASKNKKVKIVVDREQLLRINGTKEEPLHMPILVSILLKTKRVSIYQNKQRYTENKAGKYIEGHLHVTNKQFWSLNTSSKEGDFYETMHHKFIIFDDVDKLGPILVTGSFNLTEAANDKIWENIVVIRDIPTIALFIKEWEELRKPEHSEAVSITN